MQQSNKKYDVVVYGASGFTGQLVAEYMAQQYPAGSNVKWAIAGRNAKKLEDIKQQLNISSEIDVLSADADDTAALNDLCQSCKVVLTTVGPYQLYGETLLKACVENGTGYVDLCGEPAWMHAMINKYQSEAEKTGAKIVFSCGFDSVPFDLGVLFLQQHVIKETGSALTYVKGRVRKMQGTFSGGTAASLKATLKAAFADPEVMNVLRNPLSLADTNVGVEQPNGDKVYYDEALKSWAAPFIMAAINTKNIHRSNMLSGYAYSEAFQYDEMLLTGGGEKGEAMANHVANDKSLGSDKGPKPGEGPSKEERENGFYDVLFIGEHANGNIYAASVSGDKDPGYGSTSKMIAQSAVCLANETNELSGGFYTPAPAFGERLIARLQEHAGLTFKLES
ncbi:saccharopine dehydrogenase NADP-binding domain-containing protein [Glaciecola sp. XM2]|uniref:saccharopine dehydrogenase family protein n=1 Tax=Glaciecola sp. XM2 TaxID=1914931 RepID=UPI001BDEF6EA|nr:saccharopine dehydrogenase NADP-binding domain-containing protein [Glaciecola sp. XM2]MBT1449378.1 saccharopine dehydrogenase NADP-binding domain-containing protein [Glaciecola sp. XM2]